MLYIRESWILPPTILISMCLCFNDYHARHDMESHKKKVFNANQSQNVNCSLFCCYNQLQNETEELYEKKLENEKIEKLNENRSNCSRVDGKEWAAEVSQSESQRQKRRKKKWEKKS